MVVAAILEDEDVNLLKMDVAHMEADKVPGRKDPDNVGTVDAVITSRRSAERNLVDLSGHSYLRLILLLRVVLFRSIYPLSPLFLIFHCCIDMGV